MKSIFLLEQPDGDDHGSLHPVAHFSEESDADLIGKTGYGNKGYPRSDGGLGVDYRVKEITVFDSVVEFSAHPDHTEGVSEILNLTKKRIAALAKLSEDDKAVLGIKEPRRM